MDDNAFTESPSWIQMTVVGPFQNFIFGVVQEITTVSSFKSPCLLRKQWNFLLHLDLGIRTHSSAEVPKGAQPPCK